MKTKYLLAIVGTFVFVACAPEQVLDKGFRIESGSIGIGEDTTISSPISLDYFIDEKLTSFNLLCYSIDVSGEKTLVSGGALAANLPKGTISFSSERLDNGFSASIKSGDSRFSFARLIEDISEEELFSVNNYDFKQNIEYGKEIPIFSQVLSNTENLEPADLNLFYSKDMKVKYPEDTKIFIVTITFSDKEFQ